jgi:AcrR family transcriptional regulator
MGTAERKQREKEQRRQLIVDAAERLFLSKGFYNTSVDEIAEECELSKGTLYLYFHNKDEIYFHVLISILEDYCATLRANLATKASYPARLKCLGETFLAYYYEHPARFVLMNDMDHPPVPGDFPVERLNEYSRRSSCVWEIVEKVIQEGVDNGYLRSEVNPFEVGVMVWASSLGILRIIDHIRQFHHQNEHVFSEECPAVLRLSALDYEKLLRNTWEAIFARLVNPEYRPQTEEKA